MMLIFASETNPLFALFENNLINWILLAVLLVWLSTKNLPGALKARAERIESAISDARSAREQSEKFFEEQKAKIANAEAEAEKILEEAKQVAAQIKSQSEQDIKVEIAELEKKIKQQIDNESELAKTQLRAQAATVAVRLTEATLPGALTDSARARLLSEFVGQLDSVGSRK